MPKKYHIKSKPAAPRSAPVSRYSAIELEGCLGCMKCVKRTSCVYDVYKKKKFDPKQIMDTQDSECLSCFRCVQECKKNILHRAKNPLYDAIGNFYWTPTIVTSLWKQAESGKIPVSGAGYRGPFTGPGFDRMWTDMSEIVRPTRDGIHGREYISTLIELGRRPARLHFDEKGEIVGETPRFVELPMPVFFDTPRCGFLKEGGRKAIIDAASALGTFSVVEASEAKGVPANKRGSFVVLVDPAKDDLSAIDGAPVVEVEWTKDVAKSLEKIRAKSPKAITSVRVKMDENLVERVVALAQSGAEVVHVEADENGYGFGAKSKTFLIEPLRETHLKLVEKGIRDSITILLTGGIAMAEHVAKAIICGADGVGIDRPLLAAMDCRLCEDCVEREVCPVDLDNVPDRWGTQRIVNLTASWHSQLIELMGAMGIREARRLRGEVGRAMFFEDLERDNFAPIFGERVAAR